MTEAEAEVKPVVWNMFLVFLIGKISLPVLLGGKLVLARSNFSNYRSW